MIDLALHYARKGWPVFPLAAGGKEPAIRGGHGCLDATLNLNQIEAWWRACPDANIGIATGRRSGLLVIDIDPRKTDEWLVSLRKLDLPQTFTVRTCSGGWHLYFALPITSRISIGADILPAIDWRGNGGYVVAVGSTVNGSTYIIAKNLPIAPAPVHLQQLLGESRRRRVVERDAGGHMVIPTSRRNDTLMRIGCALRRWGIEYPALLESLRTVNAAHCVPSIEDAELQQIAASAARYAPRDTA